MMATKGPDDPLFKSFQEWFIRHRKVEGFPDPNIFRQYDWGEADDYPVRPYKIERLTLFKSQIHTNTSLQLSSFIGHQSWFILKRAQDFLKLSNDDETLD